MSQYAVDSHSLKYTFTGKCVAFATFLTVLSQLPQLVEQGLSSLVSRVIWLSLFGVTVLSKRDSLKIPRVTFAMVTVGCYTLFVLLASLLSQDGSYRSDLFSCVLLSFFILIVGLLVGRDFSEQDLYICSSAYVWGTVILAAVLYFRIYRGYDISNVVYAYASKNSAGVILFTGALIALVFGWRPGKRFTNAMNLLIIAFLVCMVMIMKVRAMIVCVPVVALCMVWRAPFRRKVRIPIVLLCVTLIVALQFDAVYEVLINDILYAGRGDDLVAASTGRADQWKNFFQDMSGRELIGDGKAVRESLILTALLQCGIFVGGWIIAYAAWPAVWALRRTKRTSSKQMFLLLLVAIVYFINAIFEQLAPFGPGVRCFYLWLIFGVLLSKGKYV